MHPGGPGNVEPGSGSSAMIRVAAEGVEVAARQRPSRETAQLRRGQYFQR